MPKLKHSWPFLLAILGNLILIQEILLSGFYELSIAWKLGLTRASFFTGFMICILIGVYSTSVIYLLKRRFGRGLAWLLIILGIVPFLAFFFFLYDIWINPEPKALIMFMGVYSLLLLMVYGARQWYKPRIYQTRFSKAKHIFVGIILGGCFVVGMIFLVNTFGRFMPTELMYQVVFIYLAIGQIAFQLALFFNMMDHHAYEQGQVEEPDIADLIEELGQK